MKKTAGLVGIGLVGTAIANNLLDAGIELYGYDISLERIAAFKERGGIVTSSPCEVAEHTPRVILSLRDSQTVDEVMRGADGILKAASLPRFIVDTTTGDPEMSATLSEEVRKVGVGYLDATLSGSSDHIRCRRGVFMVGGNREDFDACIDIFEILADSYFYVGGPGAGCKTKLASNLILGLNRAALAEGLVFAERMGLNLESFMEVVRLTPAYSAQMDTKAEKMIKREYTAQSKISQHRKDVDIILSYSRRLNQHLPFSEVHHSLLREAERVGRGEADTSAIIEQIRTPEGSL